MGNSWAQPRTTTATSAAKCASTWDALVALCSKSSLSPVLTEQDAWDIAMAWYDQLRGCVRLETDPADGRFHMVESFEWLTFVFNGRLADGLRDVENPAKTAAYARAASIAWFALSCCKGYGADENPLFWRRVFTEFVSPLYPKDEIVLVLSNRYRPQAPITGAVRFFSRLKCGFPRVMLVPKLEWETQCIDVFLGRVMVSNPSRDRQLERILTKLQPFINAPLWSRHLDVALDEVPVSVIHSVSSRPEDEKKFDHQSTDSDHVEMHLHSVFVSARDLRSLDDSNRLKRLRADIDIVVSSCSVDQLVKSRWLRDYVSAPSTESPCEPRKPRLRFPLVKLSEALGSASHDTEVLCSALPRLREFTTVQATSGGYMAHSRVGSDDIDWAWLGYAIFHPDAEAMSGFATLDIKLNRVEQVQIQRLAAMATGNNLLFAISGDEAQKSTAYYQAQVRKLTKVRVQDNDCARLVHQFEATSWVDICVSTDDILAFGEYTRAIVPGIGFGWILSADITNVTSRSAGGSSLRALRVATRHLLDGFDGLFWLLSAIGNSLTYLDVIDHSALLPTDVEEILSRCPALKSLRVSHDGSYWAAPDDTIDAHQPLSVPLEELELRIDSIGLETPTLHALNSSYLANLTALRVRTGRSDSLQSNHGTVRSILESHEGLRYFHWCGTRHTRDEWWPLSHDERRKKTLAFQQTLTEGVHDASRVPLTIECRLAFLSVIRCKAADGSQSPLRLFGQDIVRHITAFVSSTTARELWITD